MPISNPVLTINTTQNGSTLIIEPTDPTDTPPSDRIFWLNTVSDRLWVSKGNQSPSDWIAIGGSAQLDLATIFNSVVVANNAVVTDGSNIIFED